MPDLVTKVMISSTALDLPEHRKAAVDACQRMGFAPIFMETLTAADATTVGKSLAMVDEADIYLGIIAHRYGTIPPGCHVSVTEQEYNHAVTTGKKRLLFIMHDDHYVKAKDVDTGDSASKLETFKERLQSDRVPAYFLNPDDLKGKIIQCLHEQGPPLSDHSDLHAPSVIPPLPEAYIAQPYTLLETGRLVGRQEELNELTDWIAAAAGKPVSAARVFVVMAMGGMGKSALTWQWFNQVAPREWPDAAGRVWWSFYESDASFENFVTRTLAYVSGRSEERIRTEVPSLPDREALLIRALEEQPFLVVLDGLERILIAYARMDAARLDDSDLDETTLNETIAGTSTIKGPARPTYSLELSQGEADALRKQQLRKTADPRAGDFLKRLARVRNSRVLISTRLYPSDLQTTSLVPLAGCHFMPLRGLTDSDAVELWRAAGVSGTRDKLLEVFGQFQNYPLLVKVLAGEVAKFRDAPGDFDAWLEAHPDFDLCRGLDLKQAKSHVLEIALRGLADHSKHTLSTVVGFRMPASFASLKAVLVGADKPLSTANDLDLALTDLEDRGLIGWDRRANRYDLHPVVRGVTWGRLPQEAKVAVLGALETHFRSFPILQQLEDEKMRPTVVIHNLDQLRPVVEVFDKLVQRNQLTKAATLYLVALHWLYRYGLGAARHGVELLEMLLESRTPDDSNILWAEVRTSLGDLYGLAGRPQHAIEQLTAAVAAYRAVEPPPLGLLEASTLLTHALHSVGRLREAEHPGRLAAALSQSYGLVIDRADALGYLSLLWASIGANGDAARAADISCEMYRFSDYRGNWYWMQGIKAHMLGKWAELRRLAEEGLAYCREHRLGFGQVQERRLLGTALLEAGDLDDAETELLATLREARAETHNLHAIEAEALIQLAELYRRRRQFDMARDCLRATDELIVRGSLRLRAADALNVLARVERDAGRPVEAATAAKAAFQKAWCDGPPHAYARGLEEARETVLTLGLPAPADLPTATAIDPLQPVDFSDPLAEAKKALDWDNTTGSARKWWEAFESENKARYPLVLRLAMELQTRQATITEFFLAYFYSKTDNLQANLHYMDYTRIKKERERKKKEASDKANAMAEGREYTEPPTAPPAQSAPSIGITNTESWTDEQIMTELAEVKKALDWDNTTGGARKWWEAFESENKARYPLVLRLAMELQTRQATITEVFRAWVDGNTDDMQGTLHYMDYTRLKKEEERKKKEEAAKALGREAQAAPPSASAEPPPKAE